MIPTSYEEKINDGWILYYSEEGYPYYYKESTGESEWAPVTDENGDAITYEDGWQYSTDQFAANDDALSGEEEEEEDESVTDSSSYEDESEEGSSEQSRSGSLDKSLEEKFKEYLQTPEGIAAAEAEFERLGRKLEKRVARKSNEAEKEYVRGLKNRKKESSGPVYDTNTLLGSFQAITNRVVESTNVWMFPVQNTDNKVKKQGGAETVASSSASGNKYDINDRATKHRRGNNNLGNFGGGLGSTDARVAAAENGRAEGRSPNSSRSSSISSEAESFSSDDSDIAQLDAPIFSEVPHWLSLQSISSNLLEAFAALNSNNSNNDASSNTAVASGRGAGTDGANYSASEVVVNSANNISNSLTMIAPGTVTYLQETSLYAARQGFYIIGGAFIQGFNVLFENLNPVLENFVESLLDTSAHPIVRAARTGTVLSSSNGTTGGAVGDSAVAEVDVEQPREATRSSAPRSARTSSRSSASAAYIASASASASAPTSARSPAQPSRSRRTSGASSSRANVLSSRSAPRPELPPPSAPAHRDAVGERLVQTAAQPCVSSPFPATPVLAPAPAASVVSSKASHSDMMAMPPAPPAAILSSEKKEFATEYTAAPTPAASSQSLGQSQSLEISVDTSISSTLPPLPPPASEVVAVPGTIEVAGVGNWTNDAQSKPETLSNAVPPSAQQADAVSESADDRRRSDLSIAETSAIMHSSGLPLSPSVSSAAAAVEQAQSEEVPDGSNEDVLESAQENEKEDNSALAIPAAPAPSTTDASLEEEDVVDESTQADEAVEARSECQLGAQQESQNFSFTSLDLVGEDL